jgi:Thiol:disulfide interchange protein
MNKLKFTKKTILSLVITTFLLLFLAGIFLLSSTRTPNPIPLRYIGNWINDENNNWEYGFFEDFVIYKSDFWNYKKVNKDNEEQVSVILTKGKEKLELQLSFINENQIQIRSGNGEAGSFSLARNVYPNYSVPETDPFSSPTFRQDSATIIGYYRNLDKGLKGFASRFFPAPFEVAKYDFLTMEQIEFHADIDHLGRFEITFPVMNTEELFIDWSRTRLRAVVEPGDTLFLFVDIEGYIPGEEDSNGYEGYVDRSKRVLFMGDNARLNNEIYKYKAPWLSVNKNDVEGLTDMEFLNAHENVYNKRIAALNGHIERYPTVSEKFRFYIQEQEKSKFAFHLMQHRFDLFDRADRTFQEGYMQYVEENFPLDNELTYNLTHNFKPFLRDYIGYIKDGKGPTVVLFDEIGERLQEEGKLTDDVKQEIKEINEFVAQLDTTREKEKLIKELDLRAAKLNANELIGQTAGTILSEKSFLDTSVADSLIANKNLRELWTTSQYRNWFEVLSKPLSVRQQIIFREKVTNPYFRDYIDNIQKHYEDITNEGISYEVSLKSTEHLKEYQDADRLFEELIKPYRGKVIYIDFWGTWCAPCRENMKYVPDVEEALKGEDVIFMYFANRSPEDTWRNVIKEMNLTGENVVHYRLPDEQQGMIERKLSVNEFPTYILVNKEGKVVNTNAESPRNKNGVIKQIRELL